MLDKSLSDYQKEEPKDVQAVLQACFMMAMMAQKDMNWKVALEGPNRERAIQAYNDEVRSLESTILTRLHPDDPEYKTAVAKATPGRFLLDEKRSGAYKARGVKQGFKEDKLMTD